MSPGMRLGMGELDKHASPDMLSRMVIFTDGRSSSEKGCLNRADEAALRGLPLIALGLGTEWKEELLHDMVDRAGSIAFRDGFAKAGQRVIIVAGVPLGIPGTTNMVRIANVEAEK